MAERRADPNNRYKDRVSSETESAFGIENVRGLDRPMAAGPGDRLISEDELGNKTYQTILGTTYTIRPATAEESKTTRGKVEDWVEAGAPLPSAEQVGETLKAIPGAMLDTAERTLSGDATLGEAMSFAPGMQAASLPFEAPADALRMFGGRNAAHPPTPKVSYSAVPDLDIYPEEVREAVYKLPANSNFSDYASHFYDKGLDPQQAEDLAREAVALRSAGETIAKQNAGWSMGADGLPRFEIDDSRAVYLGQYAEVGKPTTLEAILDHGDLYYQYPELKDMPVTLKPMEGGLLGQYNPETKQIELNANKPPEEIKSTLLHEIQHAVQQIEGFDGGSNQISAAMFGPVYEAKSPEAKKAWQDYTAEMSRFETYDFTDALSEIGKRTLKAVEEFRAKAPDKDLGFSVDFLGDEARRFSEKAFSPSKGGRLLSSILDALEDYPEFEVHLKNYLPEDQLEKILKLDMSRGELSPYRKENLYEVAGVTPPTEPLFLEPNGDFGKNSFKLYKRNMGETEARNVQARQNMTREERLATPPRSTEDIPRGFQWKNENNFGSTSSSIRVDNPGGSWLESKIKRAEERMAEGGDRLGGKGLTGSVTAHTREPVMIPVEMLSDIPGALNEVRKPGVSKYDDLSKSVEESGWDPNQKGNAIVVAINHRGQPYILEGNTRLAYAKENGIKDIRAEVQWYNGAEAVDGPLTPSVIDSLVKPQRYAEGGMVGDPMDKQMEFAFMEKQPVKLADGGMIDDGATVEPTTGNEVPPGSLKEEVADTVDAKLSEGEYVVPADVVQYYGVAYFEKLRKKAKEGLAEMESNGRIGGDSEEDELPFSDDELEAEDMEEDGAQGFAEGGLAWNSPQMTGLTNTGTEMKTYVGPDGSKLPILFVNGQPIQQIPQGYTPEDQAKAEQAAFKSVRPGTGMRGQDDGQRPLNTMEAKPINEWGVEDFERYSNSQGIMKMVTALPALLGPGAGLVGLAASKAYQAQGQKALEEIDNRLAMTDLDAQSRERLQAVKDNLSSRDNEGGGLLGGLFGGEGLFGNLTDGDGLLKNLFSGGVKTTSELPADRPAQSTARPAATASATPSGGVTSSPRPQPRPTSTSSSPTSVTRTSSGNTVSRKADGTKTVSSPTGSFTPKSSGEVNPGGYNSEKESWSAGPMAEGGLVKRRYKKKK